MLDVDGTLIPYNYDALPSDRVAAAIQKASKKVTVCLVTGRSFTFSEPVLKKVNLHTGYIVVNNGSHVYDITEKKIIYDQPLERSDALFVLKTLQDAQISCYVKQEFTGFSYREPFQKDEKLNKAYMLFVDEKYSQTQVEAVARKLSHLHEVTMVKSHHKHPDKFGFIISHVKATKLHGAQIIMEKLGVQKEQVIGVGDSYNDFPLLMASGLKIAMGNAVSDLKAIADFVAPAVTEDGVVTVIEKFILIFSCFWPGADNLTQDRELADMIGIVLSH